MEAVQRNGKKKGFIAYDYKEIEAKGERLSLLLDAYESLGWEIDERGESDTGDLQKKKVRLRRDRKIINKVDLTRLQRNLEACVASIDELERSVISSATLYSVLLGLVGTAFLALATFAAVAPEPEILLCTVLAVPGFAGWIAPWFVYKRIRRKRREKTMPLIEEKYDEIYEICEKGQKLLY